jgi:MoxR-like ATPase
MTGKEVDQVTLQPFHGFTIADPQWSPGQRQQHCEDVLHGQFMALADLLHEHGLRTLPRRWELYTTSFRQHPRHASPDHPSTAYLLIDRPPRGGGIYVSLDGSSHQLVVALQLAPRLRDAMRTVLARDDGSIARLLDGCDEIRYRGAHRTPTAVPWYTHYLGLRRAGPLLAGYALDVADPRIADASVADWICTHFATLLRLHDHIIQHVVTPMARVSEVSIPYEVTPDLSTISARIHASGVIVPESFIAQFHLSLQQRPFVLLSGPPGVGKSLLARRYADALYGISNGHDNAAFLRVAVQPDWHHARDLLGYYNALADVFQATPLTRLLHRALQHPSQPFVVCLDELNLARPEYYLAPIFSALESADRTIDLGAPSTHVRLSDGDVLPNPLPLPSNVRWVGTINHDETSHELTLRALDRMHVIDMPAVDLIAWRARFPHPIAESQWQVVVRLQALLTDIGRPLGYRALNDLWHLVASASTTAQADALFDDQLRQRLTARLRGIRTAHLWGQIIEVVAHLPLTHERLQRLRKEQVRP